MPMKSTRIATLACASLLMSLWGCQLADFRVDRRAGKRSPELADDGQRLSERQVADVQLSLGRSLELQGETEPAVNAYRKAIEHAPKHAAGYWRLALLHDRQGRLNESVDLYKQAVELDPKNSDIHADYGYNLYLQRRWAESEVHLRQALEIKSGNSRARNNLGLLLAHNGRIDEAFSEFRKAGCSESDAHSNLAFVSILNQDWDRAREEYNLALDANPGSMAAKGGIEKLNALVARTRHDPDSALTGRQTGKGAQIRQSRETAVATAAPDRASRLATRQAD